MSVKKRKESMLRKTPDQPRETGMLGVVRAGEELEAAGAGEA